MAKAESKEVPVTRLEKGIVLTLSIVEAQALMAIAGRTSGDDETTLCGYASRIYRALSSADLHVPLDMRMSLPGIATAKPLQKSEFMPRNNPE